MSILGIVPVGGLLAGPVGGIALDSPIDARAAGRPAAGLRNSGMGLNDSDSPRPFVGRPAARASSPFLIGEGIGDGEGIGNGKGIGDGEGRGHGFIVAYRERISAGEYKKALLELNKGVRFKEKFSVSTLTEVLFEKSRFYEQFVGNYGGALDQLRQLELLAGVEQESIKRARREAARLEHLLDENRIEGELVKTLISLGHHPVAPTQFEAIRQALDRRPSTPYAAHLHCFAGRAWLSEGAHRRAAEAFGRAYALKPAIDLLVPIREQLLLAEEKQQSDWYVDLAWGGVALLGLIFVPLFYLRRPWRWLRLSHLMSPATVGLLWLVVYRVSSEVIARTMNAEAVGERTGVVLATPGMDIFALLDALFWFGLCGVVGAFVIALVTSRLEWGWLQLLVNTVASLLLFCSLAGIYYLRYLTDAKAIPGRSAESLPRGFEFPVDNPLPYVLSDPKTFGGMNYEKLHEPIVQEFIKRHYEGIDATQENSR